MDMEIQPNDQLYPVSCVYCLFLLRKQLLFGVADEKENDNTISICEFICFK